MKDPVINIEYPTLNKLPNQEVSQVENVGVTAPESGSEGENHYEDAVTDFQGLLKTTTRSGRVTNLPRWRQDYVTNSAEVNHEAEMDEPKQYYDISQRKDKEDWQASMQVEINNLEKNKTWIVVDRPKGKNVLGCRRVYKIKKDLDGNVAKYKSRLVVKGRLYIWSYRKVSIRKKKKIIRCCYYASVRTDSNSQEEIGRTYWTRS